MNPAELLGSSAMRDTIASLAEMSDFVLIDTAPILGIADALAIAPFVDTVLMVVDGQSTTIGDLRTARQRLDQLEISIVGSVLNRHNLASARRHYYSYRAPVSNGHAQPTQPIDLTAAPWVALQDKVSVSEGTPPQNKD
jgi:Mrp family chromosome partitioning ATPase